MGKDGTAYIGGDDGIMYALDSKTGKKKWARKASGKIISSPVMDKKGMIYVGNDEGKVFAFDSKTGAKRWEFQTNGRIDGSPAVSDDGIVYVGSLDKKVYALDTNKIEKLIIRNEENDKNEGNEGKPLVIEVKDKFVVIGGVKVPRKSVS